MYNNLVILQPPIHRTFVNRFFLNLFKPAFLRRVFADQKQEIRSVGTVTVLTYYIGLVIQQ